MSRGVSVMRTETQQLFRSLGRNLARTARLMVGIPDYETYVAHRKTAHPGEPIMSLEEFVAERQASRYGGKDGKISRCC